MILDNYVVKISTPNGTVNKFNSRKFMHRLYKKLYRSKRKGKITDLIYIEPLSKIKFKVGEEIICIETSFEAYGGVKYV